MRVPRQIALVLSTFPLGQWATDLVNAINQFSLEVVQAFQQTAPKYKTLSFATSATIADSFPIDFPVDASPSEVRIAAATGDNGTAALTVKWVPISITSSQLGVRVSLITGLSSNTTYSIRLSYQ